jgi:hypothetical protein
MFDPEYEELNAVSGYSKSWDRGGVQMCATGLKQKVGVKIIRFFSLTASVFESWIF